MLRFVFRHVRQRDNSGPNLMSNMQTIDVPDIPEISAALSLGGYSKDSSGHTELVGIEVIDTDSHDKKASLDTEQRLAKAEQTLLEILGVIKYDGFYSDRNYIHETLLSLGVDESEIHHAENTVYGK